MSFCPDGMLVCVLEHLPEGIASCSAATVAPQWDKKRGAWGAMSKYSGGICFWWAGFGVVVGWHDFTAVCLAMSG